MVLNIDGKKTTPKRLAREFIFFKLAELIESWGKENPYTITKKMTQKEKESVDCQLRKEINRIADKFDMEYADYLKPKK